MPNLHVIDKNAKTRSISVDEGWSLMEALRDHGFAEIEGVCGGSMACATCHIHVHPDWSARLAETDNERSEEEDDILDMVFEKDAHSRLSCQICMSSALDGLVVALAGGQKHW